MMHWLRRRLFAPIGDARPALLRVRRDGQSVSSVNYSGVWYPSEHTVEGTQYASGLTMIPWLAKEERLALTVEVDGREATVEFDRDRAEAESVLEVTLPS